MHPEELAAAAADLGMPAVAITDHGGIYGMVRFHAASRKAGVKPIIGCELTLDPIPGIETPEPSLLVDRTATNPRRARQAGRHHLTVLARDEEGYRNLCRMLSFSNLGISAGEERGASEAASSAPPADRKGYSAVSWELLGAHARGLVALSGCKRFGLIPRLLRAGRVEAAAGAAELLRDVFGRDAFHLEVQNHMAPEDGWLCAELAEMGRETRIPLVATNNVHLLRAEDKPLQDVLVSIRECVTLDEADAGGFLSPNSERRLKTRVEMEEALLGPGRDAIGLESWLRRAYLEALDRTVEIASTCSFDLDLRSKRFPGFSVPAGETPFSYLYQLCQEGARHRYRPMTAAVSRRLQTELEVIEKTGLAEFFLINWDLMRFARESHIPGQGRGSAADSIVAYLLGITRVDPVEHNLLFERFLHEEQTSTPDIDIDFASSRREEVIQYIYETYGYERTGMVANVVTFRPRMAIRQVGKALGFSPATVDRLAKSVDSWYPEEAEAAARAAGLTP
jgi:DNA polymerase III alpha subunit